MMDEGMLTIIRAVLLPFADKVDRAAIFGSRATGRARANSDIDLVLYGTLSQADIDRMWTLFEDSALPVTVDVVAYGSDLYPPLKRHIDLCSIPIDDLLAAA